MKPRASALLLAGAVAWGVVALAAFPRWTVDDAYIAYRYARNLAERGELTWNPGEDPVEGYTGVALPLLTAGAMRAGIDPVAFGRALGVASTFATVAFLFLAMRAAGFAPASRDAATAFLATSATLPIHSFSGLETQFYAAAATGVAWGFAVVAGRRARDGEFPRDARFAESLFALALLAPGLIRPEGAAVSGVFAAALAFVRSREGRPALLAWAGRVVALFALPGLAYFAWRWSHYGRFLPNTFYAKASGGWDARSAANLVRFLYTFALPPALALTAFALARGRRAESSGIELPPPASRERSALVVAILASLAIVFAMYLRSKPVMNYAHRFFAPYLPWLAILAAALAERAAAGAGTRLAERTARIAAPVGFAIFAAWLGVQTTKWREWRDYAVEYRQILEDEHLALGAWLRENLPPDQWLVVYLDAGAIPYVSGLPTVDFGGLNDETLAGGDLSDAEAIDYFFKRRPGAIAMTSRRPDRVDYAFEGVSVPPAASVLADPRFEDYERVRVFGTKRTRIRQSYYQFLFVRKDLVGFDD